MHHAPRDRPSRPSSHSCSAFAPRRPRGGTAGTDLWPLALAVGLTGIGTGLAGCTSPLDGAAQGQPILSEVRRQTLERQLGADAIDDEVRQGEDTPTAVEETLSERREELDELSPASGSIGASVDAETLGDDLLGREQQVVELTLDVAVIRAIGQNLGLDQARLQPAINAEDIIDAEAVFDWVFFADASATWVDQPAPVRVIGGQPVSPAFNASRAYRFETGLDKRFDTGGTLSLSTDLTRSENMVDSVDTDPDPAYDAALRLGFTQPLLRGFGRDANRAAIRLARNDTDRARSQLEQSMLEVTRSVEQSYHDLVLAWRRLEISRWLVEVGIEVRDVLEQRRAFDARDAQYADAVARVEQRQADLVRARRAVRAASDRLKVLMNDAEMMVGSELLVRPAEASVTAPFSFNLRETLLTAVERRPEIRQSLLTVDDASINMEFTENDRLPRLDLRGELAFVSLGDAWDEAAESVLDDQFVDAVLGLRFEYPFENRGADARARRARLQRTQTLSAYREAVQTVVLDVKTALRDVETNYDLIQATRSFRVAQAENLRALLVEKRTLAGLTPEFLNLEFQRQETLASARIQEFEAEVNYRVAQAALARATGTSLDRYGIDFEDASAPGPMPLGDADALDAVGR